MIKAYCARQMTGRPWDELFAEAYSDRQQLAYMGIEALDPVLAEIETTYDGLVPTGICGKDKKATFAIMQEHWRRDKRMIREAHVLIDFSPEHKSEGIAHEIGLARYAYWKPVVRFYPHGKWPNKNSVASFEDDLIIRDGDYECLQHILHKLWGSWPKRLLWRAKMYLRSAPKHYLYKLRFWFQ